MKGIIHRDFVLYQDIVDSSGFLGLYIRRILAESIKSDPVVIKLPAK